MNHNVIEPGVKPVCDALNSLPGVQTRWSCEGHPERPSRPYVTFKASSDTAFKIHCWLGSGRAGGLLNHCWWMVANFDDSGSLQYTIEPNDISFPVYRGGFFRRARSRSRSELDAELLRLSRVILELADSLNT